MQFRHVAFAVFLLLCAVPAAAQQPSVTLRFQEGLVTLRANNAPVRTILAEWARLGGATILNGDRVAGPTVTLELTDVPERQALDIVLRGVAGYMLAPRRDVSAAASTFDRILILPTSVAPRNPPPPPAAAAPARPVLPRPGLVQRQPVVPADAGGDGQGDTDLEAGADTEPGNPRPVAGPMVRRPLQPQGEEQPAEGDASEQPPGTPGVAPTATNPFGIPAGSSATPGIIAPAPRATQPQQPPANRVQ